MRGILTLIFLLVVPFVASAQEASEPEDKGRITRYLEDALSGLGREVRIDGFRGALSSRVRMGKLSISDTDGVWLVLSEAVLDWNRAAILRGEIDIEQISAKEINILRAPVAENAASPETSGFSLPELPVSIVINRITAEKVSLGDSFVGVPVDLTVDGSLSLVDGQGDARLAIERLNGPAGSFRFNGSYANTTRQLVVDLDFKEAKDGLVSTLLNLSGRPALELTAKGDAPIDDFTANVALRSDGQDRLKGVVSTRTEATASTPDETPQDPPRVIWVDIAGDLAPLFAPDYRPFFGPDVALRSIVRIFPDGRIALEDLAVDAAALKLKGRLDLRADGLPQQFKLDVALEDAGNKPVLLPISGVETRVAQARLSAGYDATQGDAWVLSGTLTGLDRSDIKIEEVGIDASGVIQPGDAALVEARIDAALRGIALPDAALSRAVGNQIILGSNLTWQKGTPLEIRNLSLEGDGLAVAGSAKVDGLQTAITLDGSITAQVNDLSRVSDLAGRPLSGRIVSVISGKAALLTGGFDMQLVANGTDLGVGIPKVDDLIKGASKLEVSALRDEAGLTLRKLHLTTRATTAQVAGFINSGQTNFEFDGTLDDLGRLVAGVNGPVTLAGEATEHDTGWLVDLRGNGPFSTRVKGLLTLPDDGAPRIKFDSTIGNFGAIVPDLPGQVQLSAEARINGDSWGLDATGRGPGGSTLTASGQVRSDASYANVDLTGALPLALLNRRLSPNAMQGTARFDLRLDGPPNLSSLTGQIRTSAARFSVPNLRNALTGIEAAITLDGNAANIEASAGVATGGRVAAKGRIGIAAPRSTDLEVTISRATLRDPKLYETQANGQLTLTGTMPDNLQLGGSIEMDRTEIRVPSTGFGGSGGIPNIVHFNEPADVRTTRRYAGLLDTDSKSEGTSGPGIGLNVLVIADSRIFIRGRGLDAELGGRLRLTGTTNEIIPVGSFDLIRGRLDMLGKRLNLEEGSARLQGDFIPFIRLVARTVSDDGTVVQVIVEGRADEPEINFVSEPDLPDDEILARLLFGRELGSLSALQAVQLASAVATLAGKGGTGVVNRLRENTGLDDLNVSSDEEGGATLGIGKYISDDIYTDVVIGDRSNTQINLNVDLSRRTKLRGQVSTDGTTGIGIFFEKDY